MLVKRSLKRVGKSFVVCLAFFMACLVWMPSMVQAFTVNVVDQDGNPVNGFRWLVEEDTTNVVTPGTFSARTLGVNIHGTYAPVATKGRSSTSSANINVSSDKRWLVSVLPDSDTSGSPRFTMSGKLVEAGVGNVTAVVNKAPIGTSRPDLCLYFPGYCAHQQCTRSRRTGPF